ncbi:histidine--tRNA ligase [Ureaplasma ceti]|uniref:Histidine--tRNA ligase n=1 Tax=Ureaplasma ceti TaxID=3119530 RepID=A0ABP9U6U5_9BACT
MAFTKPRGTQDWFGDNILKFEELSSMLKTVAELYDFNEIVTPTFENLELFTKSVGETSDIVSKELYNFKDKGDRDLALRPEGTAGAVRAYVENKMFANKTGATKLFYLINLFRYERPQGGRMREFHQFGVEYLNTNSVLDDIEAISFASSILTFLDLNDKVTLKINNLGSFKQRVVWMEELKKYFADYKDQLTEDSLKRLEKNPLRILDDKVDGQKDFVLNAPKLKNYLSDEDNLYFEKIQAGLSALQIDYEIDETLVRGLDYYTGIVFEFVSNDENLVGKSTIIGGGRYANLVKDTGGPDQEGLGFAIGIERLILALEANGYEWKYDNSPMFFIGAETEDLSLVGLSLSTLLRNLGYKVSCENGEFKKDRNAKLAIRKNATFFIYLSEESTQDEKIYIENLKTNKRELIQFTEVQNWINNELESLEAAAMEAELAEESAK